MFTHTLDDGAELGMLEPWHAEEFLSTVDRCREYLATDVPAAHGVVTLDDARRYLQRWADAHAADTRHLFGIWVDGAFTGCVQLFNFDTAMGTCEIGVWLAPEVGGRGLATKACRYVIDWAIGVRGIARVQWSASPNNLRSIAVARRLGMTKEGLLRSSWQVGGVRKDNEMWSAIAPEWPTAR